eukprot:scaffold303182_cov21-Tisochrysis_lutea.AAC.1
MDPTGGGGWWVEGFLLFEPLSKTICTERPGKKSADMTKSQDLMDKKGLFAERLQRQSTNYTSRKVPREDAGWNAGARKAICGHAIASCGCLVGEQCNNCSMAMQ